MYHIRTYLVSARYQPVTKIRICIYVCARVGYVLCATYVRTGLSTFVCTWYQPAPKICISRYVCTRATSPPPKKNRRPSTGSGSDTSSAIVVHKPKRTATSTRTIHTRQNNPYRLGAAPAGIVGARSRCCPAATVPAAVVFACQEACGSHGRAYEFRQNRQPWKIIHDEG